MGFHEVLRERASRTARMEKSAMDPFVAGKLGVLGANATRKYISNVPFLMWTKKKIFNAKVHDAMREAAANMSRDTSAMVRHGQDLFIDSAMETVDDVTQSLGKILDKGRRNLVKQKFADDPELLGILDMRGEDINSLMSAGTGQQLTLTPEQLKRARSLYSTVSGNDISYKYLRDEMRGTVKDYVNKTLPGFTDDQLEMGTDAVLHSFEDELRKSGINLHDDMTLGELKAEADSAYYRVRNKRYDDTAVAEDRKGGMGEHVANIFKKTIIDPGATKSESLLDLMRDVPLDSSQSGSFMGIDAIPEDIVLMHTARVPKFIGEVGSDYLVTPAKDLAASALKGALKNRRKLDESPSSSLKYLEDLSESLDDRRTMLQRISADSKSMSDFSDASIARSISTSPGEQKRLRNKAKRLRRRRRNR